MIYKTLTTTEYYVHIRGKGLTPLAPSPHNTPEPTALRPAEGQRCYTNAWGDVLISHPALPPDAYYNTVLQEIVSVRSHLYSVCEVNPYTRMIATRQPVPVWVEDVYSTTGRPQAAYARYNPSGKSIDVRFPTSEPPIEMEKREFVTKYNLTYRKEEGDE